MPLVGLVFGTGCSMGGARDGEGIERMDGGPSDGGRTDGKPGIDLAKPQPRGEVSFAPAVTYPADAQAFQISVGRFNADSAPDLLVGGLSQVTTYLNRGNGTFEVRPVLLGFGASWQVSAADVSSDGLGDLVLSDSPDTRYAVALGKGDGSFAMPTYPLMRVAPQGLVVVSLNSDMAIDIVASNAADAQLHVLLNNGNGTFRDTAGYAAADQVTAGPRWLAHGDFNRDGKQDIVSANSIGSLTYLAGNGDGSLQKTKVIASLPAPTVVEAAYFNADEKLDLAAISESTQSIYVYLGNGDGTFNPAGTLALTAPSGAGLQIGDVNGDGFADIVGICAFSGNARVFLGRGDGSFVPEKLFPSGGGNPFNVAIADFNLDGLNDLALSEGSDKKISILMNTTTR